MAGSPQSALLSNDGWRHHGHQRAWSRLDFHDLSTEDRENSEGRSGFRLNPCRTPGSVRTLEEQANSNRRGDLLRLLRSGFGRFCCKSPKLSGDNLPAIRRSERRAAIFIASVALARSLTSLSSGDEVPHMFTRTSRL